MKSGKSLAAMAVAGALALGMAGCSGDNGDANTSAPPSSTGASGSSSAPVELTLSGWSLSTTPEFQTLVDAFKKAHPEITVTIKEYAADQYEPLMLADMTAKQAPDIITIKQAKYTWQWASAGQLMDISDIVSALPDSVSGAGSYTVNDKNYGVPYRQDSWLLFYNKDLFDKAGVAIPDGTWTWDDYVAAAKELTSKLGGPKGTYQHSWQSALQGFANAQAGDETNPNGPFFTGDYSYMKPYYERALDLQDNGDQVALGDITTNKLTYQGEFGKQNAAMMLMGSWYIATLIAQQGTGDADAFTWGIAPAPQVDSSTVDMPVTFGDPTGMGINANIDPSKLDAAKTFMKFIASEDAATALAKIGNTPSMSSDTVTDTVFSSAGAPQDELSRTAFQVHQTYPENPSGADTMNIQGILNTTHTAIMTGSVDLDKGLADAGQQIKDKDW